MSLGHFEWCVENEALGPLLESVNARSALVLGCGTSRVEHLAQWAPQLHCVDNDEVAIREQAERLAHQKNITFEVCDLCIPGALAHLKKQQCLIDKGTLDFMLCQDPLKSAEMLVNINMVTELGGAYVILTIHPEELIQGILSVYGFTHLVDRKMQFNGCVGMVWIKETNNISMDYGSAQQRVTDTFFHETQPLSLVDLDDDRPLPLQEAYIKIIPDDLKQEYSYDMFLDDLSATHAGAVKRGDVTALEIREFMDAHQ